MVTGADGPLHPRRQDRRGAPLQGARLRADRDRRAGWALIMLFNVWVLIWPNQKKILGLVAATRRGEGEGAPRRLPRLAHQHRAVDADALLHVVVGICSTRRCSALGARRDGTGRGRPRRPFHFGFGRPVTLSPALTSSRRTSPCWSRSRRRAGPAGECVSSVCGSMSTMLRMRALARR